MGTYYMAFSNDKLDRKQDAIKYYRLAWDQFGGQGQYAEACRERLIVLGAHHPAAE